MEASSKAVKLTRQQARVLTLLFKFRFVTATSLSKVLSLRSDNTYKVLEALVNLKQVIKVYEPSYRIDRRPAYYYLSKTGVTTVRKIMDVDESVVHTLYENHKASDPFIEHCLTATNFYTTLKSTLPTHTDLFTKSEINRFKQFPKNRPDLYIRTPDGKEAVIILAHDSQSYIVMKRLDEIIKHSEDEGWDGNYPTIAFVLKDQNSKNTFLYKVNKMLENMGMDEDEIRVLATSLKEFNCDTNVWFNAFAPQKRVTII
jgi:hypothetical protein